MTFSRLALVLGILLAPVSALSQPPRVADIVTTQIRPGWKAANGAHIAALHMRLSPDWMTYWRHPGESGLVPKLDWSASGNVAGARVLWPEPRLYIKAGYASIGYSGDVVLPIEITPARQGEPVSLDATFSFGVCSDICIPVDLSLQLELNGAGSHDGLIAAALDRRPGPARAAGLQAVDCTITPEKKGLRLTAALRMPPSGTREFLLVELPGHSSRVLPSERAGDVLTGHGLFRTDGATAIDRSKVRLSIITDRGTFQHQGCAISD
jgi:DsbC/DsbD-like thiol-disulfide interchange protein